MLKLRRVSHAITLQAVELLLPWIDYDYLTDTPQRMLRGQPRQQVPQRCVGEALKTWKGDVFASQLVPGVTTFMGARR